MEIKNYDLVVVGSGISGATVAYIAGHDYHQRVLMLEKEDHVAGLAFDERNKETGVLVQKYGSHFIHTDNAYIYQFLKGITELSPFQLTAATTINGKVVPIPFHYGAIDILYETDDAARLKRAIADEYKYERYVPLMDMLRNENQDISSFAKLLMNEHFIPLEAARRGISAKKLDGRVLWGNYFQLGYAGGCYAERYQMLPKDGFTAMVKKMLSDPHITLLTGVNAMEHLQIKRSADADGKKNILYFDGQEVEIPVVYTGSLDELFDYRYGALPYYRMGVEYNIEDARSLSAPCINTPSDPEGFSRSDYSYFDCAYSGGKTVIAREFESRKGFPTSPRPSRKKKNQYQKYRKLADETENLYLCGRLVEYRFMSMADAVAAAMNMIERLPFPEIDLTPDYVSYKRPTSEILNSGNNFRKNEQIRSDLLIGDLSRDLPEVTIIIPTYKRVESLKRALQSVWQQDVPESRYDVLVLDNDPTQNNKTQQYLSTLQKENLYYYKNRKNLGAYGNMNRCMELARTDWVAMLHDDDVLFPNAIRWALNSKDKLNDPKLGIIIPRQLQAHSREEVKRRMKERGTVRADLIEERARHCTAPKRRWVAYWRLFEKTRRRYWKVSKFDCYMIPFLYPAPSYGTLINRKAMLDIGGYGEGYPTDDNLCCVKMSEKYNCYLCGEIWGIYSFYSADVVKPRSALQFVDAVVQYRLYMEQHSLRCRLAGKIMREGAYIDAVDGDFYFGKAQRGYNTARENYRYYTQYHATEWRKKWCRRLQKCWEFWVLARAVLFGKRIDFDMVERCNGEHI